MARMPSDLQKYIARKARTNDYQNADEVVCEAVRGMMEHENKQVEIKKAAAHLKTTIDKSLADIAAGRLIDADEVHDRLERKYTVMARRGR